VDQCPGQVPPRQRPSQNCWLVQDDVIISESSQMILKFVDSLRIGMFGWGEKIQRFKVKLRVPAPLVFGHRNHAGGVSERRRMQVAGAGALLDAREMLEGMGRTRNSPWCWGASQRGRRWSIGGDRRRPITGMPSSPGLTGSVPAWLVWRGDKEIHGRASEHLVGARGVL
jgi:hypothetical protein